ncbi:MAG: hypothetical protein NTY86_10145, partial [Deltaproteobacteria bacterium]|nr:hypothetical protein [Deltaproteobacteria bacterium]
MKNWSIKNKKLDPLCKGLTFWRWLLFVMLCSVFPGTAVLHGEEIREPKVAILVSRDIRPYMEAVEG